MKESTRGEERATRGALLALRSATSCLSVLPFGWLAKRGAERLRSSSGETRTIPLERYCNSSVVQDAAAAKLSILVIRDVFHSIQRSRRIIIVIKEVCTVCMSFHPIKSLLLSALQDRTGRDGAAHLPNVSSRPGLCSY